MQVCKTFARVAKKNLPNTFIYFVVFMVILIAMSANASATNGKQFQVSSVNLRRGPVDGKHRIVRLSFLAAPHCLFGLFRPGHIAG